MMMMMIYILLNIYTNNLFADADARSLTPSRKTRNCTLRSVPSSPGRSFFNSAAKKLENLDTLSRDPPQFHTQTIQNPKWSILLKPSQQLIKEGTNARLFPRSGGGGAFPIMPRDTHKKKFPQHSLV